MRFWRWTGGCPMTEERAVLAGGCFWACRILFATTTAFCRHGPATPAAACPTLRIAITAHMPKQSRSSLILPGSAIGRSSNSSSRFTTQARAITKATTSGPATDLQSSTPVTSRSGLPKTPSPTSMLQAWAGQGPYGSRSGRRLLGGRTRASGLSPTISRRLRLPFRPAPLEPADSQRQGCKAGVTADPPAKRTLGGAQCDHSAGDT